jgi:hypothetical protein
MIRNRYALAVLILSSAAWAAAGRAVEFRVQEISQRLTVGYAVRLVDMNQDGRTDIVVVDTDRVIWFQNPDWQMHTIIEHQTKTDNVCIAPYDIDGDGKLDFALGADWHPAQTRSGGTIQWLSRGKSAEDRGGKSPDELWTVHPIGTEPTVHRMQWADFDGDGRAELIVAPLQGRGAAAPDWNQGPVRILSYKIPADPIAGPWVPEVISEELHVTHNIWPTDLDGDGKLDLLVVSFEGVHCLRRGSDGRWSRTQIGSGNQQTSPNRGASEIKHGRLSGKVDYIATIEPWHGFQVVVYTRPDQPTGAASTEPLWNRHVLDEELKWGHAVWCVDLDGDGDQELVIGVRDTKSPDRPCGVRIYSATDGKGEAWDRQFVDPAGVAVEDLSAADLNGDGKPDIVAVGRATKNVRIYWNEGK